MVERRRNAATVLARVVVAAHDLATRCGLIQDLLRVVFYLDIAGQYYDRWRLKGLVL